MGSVGDGFDNAMVQSFFATLECECLAQHALQTRNEARAALLRGSKCSLIGSGGIRRSGR
jgi:putative transposase